MLLLSQCTDLLIKCTQKWLRDRGVFYFHTGLIKKIRKKSREIESLILYSFSLTLPFLPRPQSGRTWRRRVEGVVQRPANFLSKIPEVGRTWERTRGTRRSGSLLTATGIVWLLTKMNNNYLIVTYHITTSG